MLGDLETLSKKIWHEQKLPVAGSIADNIAYGLYGHCSQQQIEKAARAANAHDFITELPEGYDTMVGDRGLLLSGGQRQRIAIARALLKVAAFMAADTARSAIEFMHGSQTFPHLVACSVWTAHADTC